MGFGNTVNPPKKEDDFLNNAMSSLYSVRSCLKLSLNYCFLIFYSLLQSESVKTAEVETCRVLVVFSKGKEEAEGRLHCSLPL